MSDLAMWRRCYRHVQTSQPADADVGDIALAHQPNERIELASIPRAVDPIAQLVGRFCRKA